MLGFIVLLIALLPPVQAAEFTGTDGAPMVLIAEGPFLRGCLAAPYLVGAQMGAEQQRGKP